MFDWLITGGPAVLLAESAAMDVGAQDGRSVAIGALGTLDDEAAQLVGTSFRWGYEPWNLEIQKIRGAAGARRRRVEIRIRRTLS